MKKQRYKFSLFCLPESSQKPSLNLKECCLQKTSLTFWKPKRLHTSSRNITQQPRVYIYVLRKVKLPTGNENYKWIPGTKKVYTFPAGIYLLKVKNRNTRARCEICLNLTTKTPERMERQRCAHKCLVCWQQGYCNNVFHVVWMYWLTLCRSLHFFLVLLLLTYIYGSTCKTLVSNCAND